METVGIFLLLTSLTSPSKYIASKAANADIEFSANAKKKNNISDGLVKIFLKISCFYNAILMWRLSYKNTLNYYPSHYKATTLFNDYEQWANMKLKWVCIMNQFLLL